MIDGARILVTGGTGSFAQKFIDFLLENYSPEKIVVYSRNEPNQVEMESRLGYYRSKMRYILGDVRDYDRLYRALKGIDYVVHTAALKVVPKGEYNPLEFVSVNVGGTETVIKACCERKVGKAVLLCTDKAVMPVNLYGATKAVAEKAWVEANYIEPVFSAVRYGNVSGSRGSVINKFLRQRETGEKVYELTHEDCTRFWVDFSEAIGLVLKALEGDAGLILASRAKSYKVRDLIRAIYLRAELKITGLREGEKIHECLVNEYEAARTKVMPDHYRIFPAFSFDDTILYDKQHGEDLCKPVMSNDPEYLMGLDEVREKVSKFGGRS